MPPKYISLVFTIIAGLAASFAVLPYDWARYTAAALAAFVAVTHGAAAGTAVISSVRANGNGNGNGKVARSG